jgi:hypothetical protein
MWRTRAALPRTHPDLYGSGQQPTLRDSQFPHRKCWAMMNSGVAIGRQAFSDNASGQIFTRWSQS